MILLLIIPALSFVALVLILTLFQHDGQKSAIVGSIATAVSLGLLPFLLGSTITGSFLWLQVGAYQLTLGISLDMLSFIFLSVIIVISLFVQIYAIGYMKEELGKPRFFPVFHFL